MIVQIDKLSISKPFTASSEIPAERCNEYFAEMGLGDEKALGPMTYSVTLTNRGKHIDFEADLKVPLALSCSRCGQDFTRDFEMHLQLKLVEASSFGNAEEIELKADDLDTITYRLPNFLVDDILLESVDLELDEQCLCSESCKGVCFNCGQNLNLGDCSCPKS
ncbi:MAG: DUF177 domain-containing protein [Proteobacteria bacterium]|nr:DUF177 domain-containing protein [Pseudomonadota bacterium]